MQDRRDIIIQLHEELKGHEIGQGNGVILHSYVVQESTSKEPIDGPPPLEFALFLLIKEPQVHESMLQHAMSAYYEMMHDYAAADKFSVQHIVFSGGLKGVSYDGVDLMKPNLNLLAAYVRHQYLISSPIVSIPSKISNEIYVLHPEAIAQLKKFFHAADMQQAVFSRANIHMRKLRKGKLTVPLEKNQPETNVTIHFQVGDNAELVTTVDATHNYKITPTLKLKITDLHFTITDQDRESLLALKPGDRSHFEQQVFYEFTKFMNNYGIKVGSEYWTEVPHVK
jgi:hypothetical protein